MPKYILKKIIPAPEKIKNHKSLTLIQKYLEDTDLWHLNKRSVSKAFAIGVFCAFIPIPFQMLLAAIVALFVRANLSLSVLLVWISNPITMGPIFYCAYKIGTIILNTPEFIFNNKWNINAIYNNLLIVWKPLWVGCFVLSITFSIVSYNLIRLIWYFTLIYKIKYRKNNIS